MKIAVTKLAEKSVGIPELFRRFGHEAIVISTMCAVPPTDAKPLARLAEMASKGKLDILIFTSALGVEKLFEKAKPAKNVRIASVGPKTAQKVEEYGLRGEVIEQFSSEHFAEHLGDIRGRTVGIARADVLNPELAQSLSSKGATVIEAPAYRLVPANSIVEKLKGADALIFTSARSFEFSGIKKEHAKNLKVIAIGQKTAEAMRKHGVIPHIVGNGTLESCLARLSK